MTRLACGKAHRLGRQRKVRHAACPGSQGRQFDAWCQRRSRCNSRLRLHGRVGRLRYGNRRRRVERCVRNLPQEGLAAALADL